MSSSSKPFIGWKACEGSFYLDGLLISSDEAVSHWRHGTAYFLPSAKRMVRTISAYMTMTRTDKLKREVARHTKGGLATE